MTVKLLALKDIGEWFGVGNSAVQMWTKRYSDAPKADYVVNGHPGWLPERKEDWLRWYNRRWPPQI